jgi:putative FmdB family regulatory protein
MPFYEYKCLKCLETFEEFQSINDPELDVCKICGGELKKLISTSTSQLGLSGDSREYYEKVIKPEAHAIAEKIKNGDEDAAANIFGENK